MCNTNNRRTRVALFYVVFGCLATTVVKVQEILQHSTKLSKYYIKHRTTYGLWSMFRFQNIRLLPLLIDWTSYTSKPNAFHTYSALVLVSSTLLTFSLVRTKEVFIILWKFWFLLRYLRRTSETLDAQCAQTEALRSSYTLIVSVHEQIRVWVVIKLCDRRSTWQVHVLHAGIIRTSCKQGSALIEGYDWTMRFQPPHAYE